MRRRAAAAAALGLALAAVALAAWVAIEHFPRGLIWLAAIAMGLAAAWYGVTRRGPARIAGLGVAVALTAVAVIGAVADSPIRVTLALVCLWLAIGAARTAFRVHVALPAAPRPSRAVLFYNPRSGGGKAERFHLADEARKRGIEPIELTPGTDLETLVRDAVAGGADALAMAGGDGSQAIVAAVAAEHGLPYACIPAGTRNHFALDLGVDRDDVIGALEALVNGGERVVDLAEVNGRVFVNNVSLGLYAQAVQQQGYRDAKLRTLLDTVPDVAGPRGQGLALRWHEPGVQSDGDGSPGRGQGMAVLVSNNRYRLGRLVGSGTRPRLDDGTLGVAVLDGHGPGGWHGWSAPAFDVEADEPVPAGIDGEAMRLEPPLRFRTHPHALRVRIAPAHPGASPSAREPDGAWGGVRALAAIAAGR